MTDYSCFTVDIADNIAHIILSRPEKRNAMNRAFWDELPKIITDIDDNSRARVIVISAQGPVFSAGIDLAMFTNDVAGPKDKNHPQYGAHFYETARKLQHSFTTIENCRIPVLAAIQGGCYGGGVDLITACDMRYGTEDSFITIYEIIVGMTADVGTFPRILNHMPEGVVRELAYTGRKMMAQECKSRGLYNEVFADHAAMMDGVMMLAKTIAKNPPLAVYGCKRAITYGRDHSTADALDHIAMWNMSMLNPIEMMEAMQAKGQKRAGKFADLPKRSV
ncbi:crotonase/enoyl-CoA hydratase family protein [Robiginitomaculum antarcticum]|uniref:crotonase/enoyl-CoA hydratase family protein n=1 Tax=Robiginitomaculum antarcticum TaxID=437507 RepID=UPI0003771AC7|nr:crotonase/enoyl-CoA hydratase family protein [Robiginitomaculum antarcticum]